MCIGVQAIPPQYDRLSDRVYVYRPASAESSDDLLILCMFMGAPPKVVAKYASEYGKRFSNMTILLVLSTIQSTFTPMVKARRDIEPAVDLIVDRCKRANGRIKGAVYSNGGLSSMIAIAKSVRAQTGSPLEIDGLIIDSAPSPPNDLTGAYKAFSASVPTAFKSFPVGIVTSLLICISLLVWWVLALVSGYGDPIDTLRLALNDQSLFRSETKRTYIYSKRDEIVHYSGVESSAADAEKQGWRVQKVQSTNTRHVAHSTGDREMYWNAVEDTLK
ncbi:hypothetical protein BD324DRAFT_636902 [Kockovaella imperatae]|uniref:DUF829-domain-containing protein n=1 Tax=Kockovaella imperatae TaxID=4999 RepID=A0A1Y1U829_9TREE|nr:hypothetical protein BD324DRAFT_636902 [Kockovaella imperatae]ORX34163.1 hypothetical protein BD324DRAFT_636902 [Kockovaella imperatae]